MELDIGEIIVDEEINIEDIELDVMKEYPELEDLIVTPSSSEQKFKSSKYGYDNVTVKAIESEELSIIPSAENQSKEGLYNKVTVQGDSNLISENIKKGTTIFGINGTANVSDVEITDARYLFYKNIRINQLNEILNICRNVIDASYMFNECDKLKSLELNNFDTSNVTTMDNMFYGCSGLTNLNLSSFDTSNVTNMFYMFYGCKNLINLDISSFDTSNVNGVYYMFQNCNSLTNLNFCTNLGKGYKQKTNNYSNYKLDLSGCPLLTRESLMSVINNLYDLNLTYNVTGGGKLYRQSLVLGATNLAKLTEEEIAIATDKGWNVT